MEANISNDIDKVTDYIKKMEYKTTLLCEALKIAGSYARNNLPAEFPSENFDAYISIIVGGAKRDPQGREFTAFWLEQAKEKFLKEIENKI